MHFPGKGTVYEDAMGDSGRPNHFILTFQEPPGSTRGGGCEVAAAYDGSLREHGFAVFGCRRRMVVLTSGRARWRE
jgi:hypothetical protein